MSHKRLGFMQLTIVCGFSMFYAWYLIAFFGLFMSVPGELDFFMFHMGQVVFFLGSIAATAVLLVLFKRADSVALGHARFLYLASLVPGLALPACMLAQSLEVAIPLPLFYLACFLSGSSIAIGFMLWEDLATHGYLRHGVFAHGIVFCAGGILFLAGTAFLSLAENAVLSGLLLCLSTALIAFIAPRCEITEDKTVKPTSDYFREIWYIDVVVAVNSVAFGYSFVLLYHADTTLLLIAMAVAIGCDLVLSYVLGRGKWLQFTGAVRVCAGIVSCALIAFVAMDPPASSLALCVVVVFWFLFRTMNGGSVTDLANKHDFSALYSATRGKMPANIGFTLGLLAGVGAIASESTAIADLHVPLAIVAAFIVSALFLLPFDADSKTAGYRTLAIVEMHEGSTARQRASCEEVARRFKLSPRETETLAYLMAGRNAKHISEKLYISESTAKTHISNIYRKAGVHSQQELLDVIEQL